MTSQTNYNPEIITVVVGILAGLFAIASLLKGNFGTAIGCLILSIVCFKSLD